MMKESEIEIGEIREIIDGADDEEMTPVLDRRGTNDGSNGTNNKNKNKYNDDKYTDDTNGEMVMTVKRRRFEREVRRIQYSRIFALFVGCSLGMILISSAGWYTYRRTQRHGGSNNRFHAGASMIGDGTQNDNDKNDDSKKNDDDDDDKEMVRLLQQRMVPQPFVVKTTDDGEPSNVLAEHQFLHLHHMKTGGTSMDQWIRCGADRLRRPGDGTKGNTKKYEINHQTIHECSDTMYKRCRSGRDKSCQERIASASFLSYCAPLKDLPTFSWDHQAFYSNPDDNNNDEGQQQQEQESQPGTFPATTTRNTHHTRSITVLRNPVDRVWSMYRFQTRACYHCLPLLEIYNMMDNGTIEIGDGFGRSGTNGGPLVFQEMCLSQLVNHETANLLHTEWNDEVYSTISRNNNGGVVNAHINAAAKTNAESVNHYNVAADADDHGRVEEAIHNMKHFFTMIGITEEIPATVEMASRVFPWLNQTVDFSPKTCSFPHANASPSNNHCADNGKSHMPLPNHPPDQETIDAIIAHNALDMKLYQAAVHQFELQKQVMKKSFV